MEFKSKTKHQEKSPMDPSWMKHLKHMFEHSSMQRLNTFLQERQMKGYLIYPSAELYFAALNETPLPKVKVVILGQDPYHGAKQAHGLSFSVQPGIKIPPSLRNIYTEIKDDLGITPPNHGYLKEWAQQGVLLLNTVLSVEEGAPASHRNKGWESFTDEIMTVLNRHTKNCVFLLWGASAQKKGKRIDRRKHLVLEAPHPSPLSAHRGFFGCRHFSKSNEYLKKHGKIPIDWSLQTTNDALGDTLNG